MAKTVKITLTENGNLVIDTLEFKETDGGTIIKFYDAENNLIAVLRPHA